MTIKVHVTFDIYGNVALLSPLLFYLPDLCSGPVQCSQGSIKYFHHSTALASSPALEMCHKYKFRYEYTILKTNQKHLRS